MNIENLDKAIAVMERAKLRDSVDMTDFQTPNRMRGYSSTEEELHACGNKACFAGHIAISPEWLETSKNHTVIEGVPVLLNENFQKPAKASLATWFEIDNDLVDLFIFNTDFADMGIGNSENHVLYDVPWEEVKAEHVIEQLTLLRDLGEVEYCKLKGISI